MPEHEEQARTLDMEKLSKTSLYHSIGLPLKHRLQ